MDFKYCLEKNRILLDQRGVNFDAVIQAVADGALLAIKQHPNRDRYAHQKIMYVKLCEEVYAVPFVEMSNGDIFLKTLYPSRKARRMFLFN